jgi:transcriptional regulator with XRE-family HTH domain
MIFMTVSPGARIKELRLIADMSQEELGRRVGVQRAAIQKYEKGTVTNIPLITIERIANVFDVSPTYIVGWSTEPSNPLAAEVRIIQGIKKFFGTDAVELLEIYVSLNNAGKKRLVQYAEDIARLYGEE